VAAVCRPLPRKVTTAVEAIRTRTDDQPPPHQQVGDNTLLQF